MTNTALKVALKIKLGVDAKWALRALEVVYARQTADEQVSQNTKHINSMGFTGVDATLLSSFAQQYQKWGKLSEKQMAFVFKKMPKYWGQIVEVAGKEKLTASLGG